MHIGCIGRVSVFPVQSLYPHGLNSKFCYYTESSVYTYDLFSSVYRSSFHYRRGKTGNHSNKALCDRYKIKVWILPLCYMIYTIYLTKTITLKKLKLLY